MLTNLKVKIQNLRNHSGFRRYFANTAWLFAEKILRMVVGLFVGVWVARYLGPERFGLLSYAQSFVGLFGAIATLGLDGIVVRELVKNESKREVLLGTSFVLKLIGAFLVFAVLAVAVRFTKNDAFTNLLIFIIGSGLLFQSFNVIDLYFQSKVLSMFAVWANTISFFLSSSVKIILLILKAPLIAFAIVAVFDSFATALGYVYFYRKYGNLNPVKWKFNLNVAKRILSESWPLILSILATSVSLRVSQLILKEYMDFYSVGIYTASLNLVQLWFFIPVVISQSLFPSLVTLVTNDKETFDIRRKSISSLLIYLGIIITMLVFIFSDYIVKLLYGIKFIESSKLLKVHIISIIFVFFVSIRKKLLLIQEKTALIMRYTLTNGVTMVILTVFFVKKMGVIGAAVAYTLTWGINVVFLPILFRRLKEDLILFFSALNFLNIKQQVVLLMDRSRLK